MDTHITEVIFRKFKGEIIALFPYIPEKYGECLSYMHVGQHGTASLSIIRDSKPTNEPDFKDLFNELTGIGYNLKVIKRMSWKRYNTIYRKSHDRHY